MKYQNAPHINILETKNVVIINISEIIALNVVEFKRISPNLGTCIAFVWCCELDIADYFP